MLLEILLSLFFLSCFFFFFNDTATTEIYTLSLHDALPISVPPRRRVDREPHRRFIGPPAARGAAAAAPGRRGRPSIVRRLSGARRLRRASRGDRARPGGRDPGGEGLQAPRAWRRGLPHRREVGGRREATGATSLLRVQCGRVRARHVQGPGGH